MSCRPSHLLAVVAMLAAPGAVRAATLAELAPDAQLLFVQQAVGGSYDGETLTLSRPTARTIWFTDRPARLAGSLADADFAAQWDKGDDDFATDPPNAVLTIAGDDDEIVVELLAVAVTDAGISYRVTLLDGEIPAAFGAADLFIDDVFDTQAYQNLEPANGQYVEHGRRQDYEGMGTSTGQMINSLGH